MPAAGEASENDSLSTGPVRVRFRADMVARLKRAVLRSTPAGTDHEVGGALLGRASEDALSSTVLDVSDFMILPSSREPGHDYGPPLEEIRRLRDNSGFGRGARAIGYFRTQCDPDLMLRDHEISRTREFPDGAGLILLLHVASEDRVLAGVLHSDGGQFRRTPAKLFQFDEAAFGPLRPVAVPPAVAAPVTAAVRAAPARNPRRLLVACVVALAALLVGASGAYWWGGGFGPSRTNSARVGSPGVGSAPNAPAASPAAGPLSPLEMSVNRANGGLIVSWNGASMVNAAAGQLVITDGDSPSEIVPLTTDELRKGKVFYRTRSERLRLRVEATDSIGRRASDSVLVLGGSQAAAPSSQGAAQRAVTQTDAPALRAQESSPVLTSSEPASVRKFQPPPEPASRPVERTIVLDTPPPIAIGAPKPLSIAQARIVEPPLESVAPAQNSPGSPAPPKTIGAVAPGWEPVKSNLQASRTSREYKAPVVLSQITPRLDPVIRSVLVNDVEIEVKLQIDASGRVVRAEPLQTQPGLHQHVERAAVEAAERWRFKPATIDGKNVPSVETVKFVFRK